MPKLTRDFILKVKEKYEEFQEAQYYDPSEKYEEISFSHEGEMIDVKDMENDQLAVDLFAISCLVVSRQPQKIKELSLNLKQWGYNDIYSAMQLFANSNHLDRIESIENGALYFAANNRVDDDLVYEETEDYNDLSKLGKINEIFTKDFLSDIIDGKGFEDNSYYETVNYEKNKDNKVPLYEMMGRELDTIKTSYSKNRTLKADATDANKLLSYYSALQERSEKRTWADVFKHPWNSFREWLAKGSIKSELKNRFELSDNQLNTLDNIVRKNDTVPEDYVGLQEDGKYVSSKSFDESENEIEQSKDEIEYETEAYDKKHNKDLSNLELDSSLDQQKGGKSQAHKEEQKLDVEKVKSQD